MSAKATFNRDAVGELFTMLLSGLTVVVMWVGLRLPDAGMELLMGALFMASTTFYLADPAKRAKHIFFGMLLMGGLQFVVAMLMEQKFLLLIYLFIASYCVVAYYPDRRVAVFIVAMCCLTLVRPHGFEAGMNRWILFFLQSPFLVFWTWLGRRAFPPLKSPTDVFPPPGMFAAFQFAVMMALALFLFRFFQLPNGDWLIYSIVLVHFGGVFGADAVRRAQSRFFVAPLGLWLAFIFTATTVWFDYRMAYCAAFLAGIGFFYSRCYRNFTLFSMIFMTFFILMYDLGYTWNGGEFDMLNLMFSRLLNITLGMALSILAEPVIVPLSLPSATPSGSAVR